MSKEYNYQTSHITVTLTQAVDTKLNYPDTCL